MAERRSPLGLIGLGLVGTALAERLLAAGYRVVGHDIRPGAVAALEQRGGCAASSAAAVGGECACVVLSLPDSDCVRTVVEGPEGLLTASPRPTLIIDTTTGDPDHAIALAERLAASGLDYVDATLSGSSQQVRQGDAVVMVGGKAAAVAEARPVLEAISPRVFSLGPVGNGAKAKLASNVILGLNRAALAEGLVFAERLGLDGATFLELLKVSPAYSVAMDVKGDKMVTGEFTPQSKVRQHLKDVSLILEHAASLNQRLPLSECHHELLRALVAAGQGDLDNAALIAEIRRRRTEAQPRGTERPH